LYGNKDYNEYNIRVILAANLFGPLAGNYEIGNKGFLNNARRCPKCKMDISENLKNTSLGNYCLCILNELRIFYCDTYSV
jgi:hypothetical protein